MSGLCKDEDVKKWAVDVYTLDKYDIEMQTNPTMSRATRPVLPFAAPYTAPYAAPYVAEIPRCGDLLKSGVAIFDLDFDAILAAMYAVSISAEGDCYVCVPPDPGIEAAALGASESAAPGAHESAAPGTRASALSGTASAQVLHTFTLDSGASRSFRDRTTLTPLSRPVAVSLADPSGGPILAHYSTVLPCPAALSGFLSGLYLPSFSTNLVSGADLQDGGVDQFTPASQRVTHCTCARTGRHLATWPGSSLYTLTTESPPVAASGLVAASSQVFAAASQSGLESAPYSCRLLSHQTLLWHHRLGHPSLRCLRGMASRVLVSGLPRSLPPLPPGPALTCVPCVEGRQRAAPHSSEFPPTEAPLQTLHMDVWGPARVRGQGHERYFMLMVDDYSRYTTVFPLRSKGEVTEVLIDWIRVARLQLRERFGLDFRVLRLHSDRDVHASGLSTANGIAERHIGMVMDVVRTSMIHAAARHFLWPLAVQYAAHQLNLQPRVSISETSPTLRWTGKVGDASVFRVWGSRAFFYHPTSRRVLSSQDVTFDESVPYYHAVEPVEVAVDSGTSGGAEHVCEEPGGAGSGGAEPERAEPGGAGSGGAERGDAESGSAESAGAGPGGPSGALSRRELPSPHELREWFARRWSRAVGASGTAGAGGSTSAGGAGATSLGGARTGGTGAAGRGGATGAGATGAAGAGSAARVGTTGGTGAGAAESSGGPAGAGAAVGAGGAAGGTGVGVAAGAGALVGAVVDAIGASGGTARAGGTAGVGADAAGAVSAGSRGATRPRPYFVPLLEQVLGLPPSSGPAPSLECPPPVHSESQLQLASPLPTPSPYTGPTGGLAESREPESRPTLPVRTARTSRRVPRQRPPAVPSTHHMALRPSTVSQRVPLPSPPASSLPALANPESDSLRAASPTVTRFLATVVTDPSFESATASALVAELVDFAAHYRLDYAASLVAESASVCAPSVGGECALSTDVLEDRQEEFQCFAAALPHLVSTLLAPEGDLDAPDIPTPRSYAIEGPYSSQWQAAMDAEMASWKSTGTYVDKVPPPGANIVSGMWIFRVKRPPGSPPVFKLHSLDFSTAFLQGSLHEEIWLRRPPGFTGSFPPGTQWSLRRSVYGLRQAPREWHDTLRTTLAALGFAPSTADSSLFLHTDTLLPPFYILVYVDDLVFATADTAGLAHVKSELQKRHTCTDLGEMRSYLGLQITRDRARCTITLTQSHMVQQVLQRFDFTYSSPQATPLSTRHSLSALPLDESVEPSGPYRELVGYLMYLMTCTRPNLAYPLSILARFVAPGRHRPKHMAAAKRVLRYLCSTSSMGLVLRGWSPVVLTNHSDASWVDDLATQRSSQGYTFSLGSGSVSWRSTCCEAEIYIGAMAAQELRWLTYLLTHLGEPPRSPPVLYANTTDIFTKALQPCDHQRFCSMLACFALLCLTDRGGEFSSDLLRAFCRMEGIRQTFTLLASPQQNGIAERCIGMVMDIAHTSMIHAAAPHFLWPFAVQYAAHQVNLQPRVSLPETTPPLWWTGKVGDASVFHPAELVEVAVDSGAAWGAEPTGAGTRGAEPGVSVLEGAEPGGAETERVEPGGAEPGGAESGSAELGGAEPVRAASGGPSGVPSRREPLSSQQLREWYARRCRGAAGSAGAGVAAGSSGAVGGPVGVGPAGGAGAAGVRASGAGAIATGGTSGAGGVGGTGPGGAAGVVAGDPGAEGTGAISAVSGGAAQPRPYYVPLLQQVLGLPPSHGPYSRPTRGLTEHREPESRPVSPESRHASPESHSALPARTVRAGRRVSRPRPVGATLRFAFGLLSVCVHACVHGMVCVADFQELKEEFTLKNQSLGFKNQVISKLSKRFRDPSWLGTVWHCSTSLYLGSWGL
ncbi:unnamed protein product [Closterium sp. NIES-53]